MESQVMEAQPHYSGASMQESLPAESLHQDILYLWVVAMYGLQQFLREGLLHPRAGEPDGGLGTITPLGEPLQYNYFHLRVTHPVGLGFNYIAKVPSYHFTVASFFVFGCRIFVLVGSSLFCLWLFSS